MKFDAALEGRQRLISGESHSSDRIAFIVNRNCQAVPQAELSRQVKELSFDLRFTRSGEAGSPNERLRMPGGMQDDRIQILITVLQVEPRPGRWIV